MRHSLLQTTVPGLLPGPPAPPSSLGSDSLTFRLPSAVLASPSLPPVAVALVRYFTSTDMTFPLVCNEAINNFTLAIALIELLD
jgi:hypothetical protein